jgi:hypothetical protein
MVDQIARKVSEVHVAILIVKSSTIVQGLVAYDMVCSGRGADAAILYYTMHGEGNHINVSRVYASPMHQLLIKNNLKHEGCKKCEVTGGTRYCNVDQIRYHEACLWRRGNR